jgi:Rieske 2Fe-2S family protein
VTRELGSESLLCVRGADGAVRVFFNVCRHRGSRLVEGRAGRSKVLQCPYHAWTYDLQGALRGAPNTDRLPSFDKSCLGLRELRSQTVDGLVFADATGEAPPLEDRLGGLAAILAPYRLGELALGETIVYDVAANWKAIAENYNECDHCPGVHPEFVEYSNWMSGEFYEGGAAWCGGTMDLKADAHTMAFGGGGERDPLPGLDEAARRTVGYLAIFPNLLISLHPDYVMVHTLWPKSAGETEVRCDWLFDAAAMTQPGFDGSDAVAFWDLVNRQDWHVCELAQRGAHSRGFGRGRYSGGEGAVHEFDRMVARSYLAGRPADAPLPEPTAAT